MSLSFFRRACGVGRVFVALAALVACTGCDAARAFDPGILLGQDHVVGSAGSLPAVPGPIAGPNPGPRPIGPGCSSDDPNRICLSLKYVAYVDSSGEPVVSQDDAVANVRKINSVWSKCGIAFQIDAYRTAVPADYGLVFQTADDGELDRIRSAFGGDSTLLVVTTGPWDRTGALGETTANAWTSLPGTGPYGVVLERPVATYANLIAHELGHYLNLLHVPDPADLMNPVVYSGSTGLYESQCETARSTASFYWAKTYR